MPATLTPVWTADELERELQVALELVDRLDPPEDLRVPVFNTASQALLQRVVERAPQVLSEEDLRRLSGAG